MKQLAILFLFFLLSCSSKELTTREKKAELYYAHGTSKLLDKDYTTALDNLLKAHDLTPDDSKIHNNLGMTYYFKKQYGQAEHHLRKAIDINPKNSDASNNLASVYYHRKKFKEAESQYYNILRNLVYQHQYRIHYNLALLKLKARDNEKAFKHLYKAVEIKDDYCPAHILLGQMEKKAKNLVKALKHFDEGIKGTCFNIPQSHYLKALTLIEMGQYEKANDTLEQLKNKFYTSPYAKLAEQRMREIGHKSNPVKKSWADLLPSQKKLLRELERESEFKKAYEASKF